MLRVVSWNISCMGGDPSQKLKLLRSLTQEEGIAIPAVIALQEVTEKAYKRLSQDDLFALHTYPSGTRLPALLKAETALWVV